jgi:rSAM/selenodomain-associated transferase 1
MRATDTHVLVLAKAPVAGRVKTRLCPPCSTEQAAAIAEAALADTLDAVSRCNADRRVIALDGEPGLWLPSGFEMIAQSDGGLAARLAAAWDAVGGPGLQIGMDTPQVTPDLLDHGLEQLMSPSVDAVLGPAEDGGWWSIGLRQPDRRVFAGVPMSTADTGAAQLAQLERVGLVVRTLPRLQDLDRMDDALTIAQHHPTLRTTRAVRAVLAAV